MDVPSSWPIKIANSLASEHRPDDLLALISDAQLLSKEVQVWIARKQHIDTRRPTGFELTRSSTVDSLENESVSETELVGLNAAFHAPGHMSN